MRNAILVSILAAVLVAGAASVYAGPPVAGTYKSTLGQFDEGKEASAWPGANGMLSTGNVLYAESNDAANDWVIGCPIVTNVSLIVDLVFAGTGQRIYLITYAGGYLKLGGVGTPWTGGDAVYNGVIDTYYETRTQQWASGELVGSVSDHAVSAHITGYPAACVAWAIGNGVLIGHTGADGTPLLNVKAPAYPAFHDANCNVTGGNGHWGDIRDLTLTVQGCAVPVQQSTWGEVKSLYRD